MKKIIVAKTKTNLTPGILKNQGRDIISFKFHLHIR